MQKMGKKCFEHKHVMWNELISRFKDKCLKRNAEFVTKNKIIKKKEYEKC